MNNTIHVITTARLTLQNIQVKGGISQFFNFFLSFTLGSMFVLATGCMLNGLESLVHQESHSIFPRH